MKVDGIWEEALPDACNNKVSQAIAALMQNCNGDDGEIEEIRLIAADAVPYQPGQQGGSPYYT
jgi:hypothetical protein